MKSPEAIEVISLGGAIVTVPTEYQQTTIAFYEFLTAARDQMNFQSTDAGCLSGLQAEA